MSKIDKNIDYAIIETLRAHPDYSQGLINVLFDNATKNVKRTNFTSQRNARNLITNLNTADFIEYILKKTTLLYGYVLYYKNNDEYLKRLDLDAKEIILRRMFSNLDYVKQALSIMSKPNINSIAYYQMNPNELLPLVDFVVKGYFNIWNFYDSETNTFTNKNIDALMRKNLFIDDVSFKDETVAYTYYKIEDEADKLKGISNLQFNQPVVNKCLNEIFNGKQLVNKHNYYSLNGNLYASQDIGNVRKNQEDSVVIMSHPQNKDFKLLVVSDGMGGGDKGEVASQTAVQEIAKWFNSIPVEMYEYPLELQALFNKEIEKISNVIYKKIGGKGGATFVGALVTEKQTVISNIGDSRAMRIKGRNLDLLTQDESVVYRFAKWKKKNGPSPEELNRLRFRKDSNTILRYLGEEKLTNIQSFIINNKSYDKLMLFRDGITDLLTLEEIKVISRNTPPEYITEILVQEALKKDAINPEWTEGMEEYKPSIKAGKDNASAAMYVRR